MGVQEMGALSTHLSTSSTHLGTSSRPFLHSCSLKEIKFYKTFPYYYSLAQPQCSGTVPVLLTLFCLLFPCPKQIWYSFPWPFYPRNSEENGLEMTYNFLSFFPPSQQHCYMCGLHSLGSRVVLI